MEYQKLENDRNSKRKALFVDAYQTPKHSKFSNLTGDFWHFYKKNVTDIAAMQYFCISHVKIKLLSYTNEKVTKVHSKG